MRCDDFICLGRTVPEESKKYGTKVCMAGISRELAQLMRVYPLPVQTPIKTRHQCVLELQRNHQDTRKESWKLHDREKSIVEVSSRPVIDTSAWASLLNSFKARSIEELNDDRKSLGILEVQGRCQGIFRSRSNVSHPDQGTLFDITDECFGAGSIDVAPYLEFWDADCKRHELQLREWGCYEWLRKDRSKATQLWDNLQINGKNSIWILVGNMTNRRNVWLVIKTFVIPSTVQHELFAAV